MFVKLLQVRSKKWEHKHIKLERAVRKNKFLSFILSFEIKRQSDILGYIMASRKKHG